jgi:hypothetical protein
LTKEPACKHQRIRLDVVADPEHEGTFVFGDEATCQDCGARVKSEMVHGMEAEFSTGGEEGAT